MGEVVCLVYQVELLVGFMGGFVLIVDMSGLVNNIQVPSGFGLQVVLVGYINVLGTSVLRISCVT